jgi:dTDP-4-amino-4,6-dideoxygalactose transaminase
MNAQPTIPFIDFAAQRRRLGPALPEAIQKVVDHGGYILGPEVGEFEKKLAAFCGAKHAIGCANGTDAIVLCMLSMGLKPRQAVLVPSFTFASTAEVVAWVGAIPLFCDVHEDTFNLDVASAEAAMATAKAQGLEVVGIVAVDLFGLPADYAKIDAFASANKLWVISDSAQGFGGTYHGKMTGSLGRMATTSFFPAKPLGCYGDGGAVFTDEDGLADHVKSLRVHGKGSDKYDNVRIGMNSRLDTIQAAILLQKLAIYAEECLARDRAAQWYTERLSAHCATPVVPAGLTSVWAQYTLRVPAAKRDALGKHLQAHGIPSAVYYPKPLHRQTAYKHYPAAGNGLPVSDRLAGEVISLPMHPYLDEATVDRVAQAVISGLAA